MYRLAEHYYGRGEGGLVRDPARRLELLQQAASQKPYLQRVDMPFPIPNDGVASAENALGLSYQTGDGVDIDHAKAAQWFLRSAIHGSPAGQNNLAAYLHDGLGNLTRNLESAREWFRRAATHDETDSGGFAAAQFNLAGMLEKGEGGPVDMKEAKKWYERAAKQGLPQAIEALQRLARSGALGTAAYQSPPSLDLLRQEIAKGNPDALYLMGRNYLKGAGGVSKDFLQAVQYFHQAAALGHTHAQYRMGRVILKYLTTCTPSAAVPYLEKASSSGHLKAQFFLGRLYAYGHGCARDEEKARRLLNRAECVDTDRHLELGRVLCEFEQHTSSPMTITDATNPRYLSIEERLNRLARANLDSLANGNSATMNFVQQCHDAVTRQLTRPRIEYSAKRVDGYYSTCLLLVRECAQRGSVVAQRFLEAYELQEQALQMLLDTSPTITTSINALHLMRKASPPYDLCTISDQLRNLLRVAIVRVLDQNPTHADSLYIRARIFPGTAEEVIQQLERCITEPGRDHDAAATPAVGELHCFCARKSLVDSRRSSDTPSAAELRTSLSSK